MPAGGAGAAEDGAPAPEEARDHLELATYVLLCPAVPRVLHLDELTVVHAGEGARSAGTSTMRSSVATMIRVGRCAARSSQRSSRDRPCSSHSRSARGSARSWLRKFDLGRSDVDVVALDQQPLVEVADDPAPAQPADAL